MDERKPNGWIRLKVTLIGALAFYLASWGPACWIASRINGGEDAWNAAYFPVIRCLLSCPDRLCDAGERFLLFGMPNGTRFWHDHDSDSLRWVPFEFDSNVEPPLGATEITTPHWRDRPAP
jgi:hypothetical protein